MTRLHKDEMHVKHIEEILREKSHGLTTREILEIMIDRHRNVPTKNQLQQILTARFIPKGIKYRKYLPNDKGRPIIVWGIL